jgi:hypothetical protein
MTLNSDMDGVEQVTKKLEITMLIQLFNLLRLTLLIQLMVVMVLQLLDIMRLNMVTLMQNGRQQPLVTLV